MTPIAQLGELVGANTRWISMILVFVVLAVIFNVATGGIFLSPRNLTLLMRQGAIISIVAMGVSLLIIKGEIDLSIGSAVYLCGTAAATLQLHYAWPVLPTVAVTLSVGLLLGAWQGLWVVALRVPSFVVTLGGLLAFRGLGYFLTDAATLAPMSQPYTALSEGFVPVDFSMIILGLVFVAGAAILVLGRHSRSDAGGGVFGLLARIVLLGLACVALAWIFAGYRGIPNAVLWVAGCGLALWFLMSRTVFGRNAYLIGSNREAARLAGVDVKLHMLGGFLIMGAFYAVAATLATARLSASTPALGQYLELDAIAAAVIGGTSLRGGIGSVGGAILGAALLVTIDNGMSLLNISSFVQMIIKGMILLVALAADVLVNRSRSAGGH